jgi:hypothetical protein
MVISNMVKISEFLTITTFIIFFLCFIFELNLEVSLVLDRYVVQPYIDYIHVKQGIGSCLRWKFDNMTKLFFIKKNKNKKRKKKQTKQTSSENTNFRVQVDASQLFFFPLTLDLLGLVF